MDGAGPHRVAAAAAGALDALVSELDPLIGNRGVSALYRRSLQLVRADFPWLCPVDASETTSTPGADLRANLDRRSADEAGAASLALLTTLTNLLATLIGEPLTHRILLAAWGTGGSGERPTESKP